MALKIDSMSVDHLGSVRRLFEMFAVEHLTTTPYPLIDEEEVDNFILATYRNLTQNPHAGAWVAVRGHKVVGFIIVEVQHRAVGKPNYFAAVHWIYTHPRHRQHGIARRLLGAAIEWARARGITYGEWCSIPGDEQWSDRGVPTCGAKYALPTTDAPALFLAPKVSKIG